jgi:hypothetical protein
VLGEHCDDRISDPKRHTPTWLPPHYTNRTSCFRCWSTVSTRPSRSSHMITTSELAPRTPPRCPPRPLIRCQLITLPFIGFGMQWPRVEGGSKRCCAGLCCFVAQPNLHTLISTAFLALAKRSLPFPLHSPHPSTRTLTTECPLAFNPTRFQF